MQEPSNPYSPYPQFKQQKPNNNQSQTYRPSQQQFNPLAPQKPQPSYYRPQPYFPPQQQPMNRPKRNRVVLWVSSGIFCAVLVVLVVIGSLLISYSSAPSPSQGITKNLTPTSPSRGIVRSSASIQYPILHTEYMGTLTSPPLASNDSATVSQMALIITSNDNQGHISGRVGILAAPNGGDPFTGTLKVDGTITFTATPLMIGVSTDFTGKVHHDGSISGTTENFVYQPDSWKLYPVKGT